MKTLHMVTAGLLALTLATPALAAEYTITLKDHKFSPQELVIPANEKATLIVKNENTAPAEFESHELKREKVIPAGAKAVIKLGPLAAGSYPYFDEFHEASKGTIVVK